MYFFRRSVHGDLPKIRKSKTGVAEDIPAELAGETSRDISTTPPTQLSASAAFKNRDESSVNHCKVRSKIIS